MFYPNQKMVSIHRDKVLKGSREAFLCAYEDNLMEAMKNLSHTAFKVYIVLLLNKDGFNLEYSPTYISYATGMCVETARKCLRELEEKNYVIKSNNSNYGYDFYERPHKKPTFTVEKREFIDRETGEIYQYTYEELVSIAGVYNASTMWEGAKVC